MNIVFLLLLLSRSSIIATGIESNFIKVYNGKMTIGSTPINNIFKSGTRLVRIYKSRFTVYQMHL